MTTPRDRLHKTIDKAPRITIFGMPGIGKTTLASQFPNPCFVFTEEPGLANLEGFEVAKTYKEFLENIQYLLLGEHSYKTIVIDSLTKLDRLIVEYSLSLAPSLKGGVKPRNLVQAYGGYRAGFHETASYHVKTKELLDNFQKMGIGVIYIGHMATSKESLPDEEDFTKYNIEMSDALFRGPYINDVDAILFCRQKPVLEESEKGRTLATGMGKRCIITQIDASHVSKNRYKMPPIIDMDIQSIMKYIPFYNSQMLQEVKC